MNDEGDLSAAPQTTPTIRERLDEHSIREKAVKLGFKTLSFYAAGLLAVLFYFIFILYVFFAPTHASERLTITGFLGAVPTVLILAVLRYAFAKDDQEEDEQKSPLGILHGLASEAIGLLKAYLEKK